MSTETTKLNQIQINYLYGTWIWMRTNSHLLIDKKFLEKSFPEFLSESHVFFERYAAGLFGTSVSPILEPKSTGKSMENSTLENVSGKEPAVKIESKPIFKTVLQPTITQIMKNESHSAPKYISDVIFNYSKMYNSENLIKQTYPFDVNKSTLPKLKSELRASSPQYIPRQNLQSESDDLRSSAELKNNSPLTTSGNNSPLSRSDNSPLTTSGNNSSPTTSSNSPPTTSSNSPLTTSGNNSPPIVIRNNSPLIASGSDPSFRRSSKWDSQNNDQPSNYSFPEKIATSHISYLRETTGYRIIFFIYAPFLQNKIINTNNGRDHYAEYDVKKQMNGYIKNPVIKNRKNFHAKKCGQFDAYQKYFFCDTYQDSIEKFITEYPNFIPLFEHFKNRITYNDIRDIFSLQKNMLNIKFKHISILMEFETVQICVNFCNQLQGYILRIINFDENNFPKLQK